MPQSIPQNTKNKPITPALAAKGHTTKASSSVRSDECPSVRHSPLNQQFGRGDQRSPAIDASRAFLTVKEIAAEMRVGLSSVTRLVKLGRLQAVNISSGRRPTYRVLREAYEDFKKNGTVNVAPIVQPERHQKLPPGIEQFV
jgi:excisionase family DNA binding protein